MSKLTLGPFPPGIDLEFRGNYNHMVRTHRSLNRQEILNQNFGTLPLSPHTTYLNMMALKISLEKFGKTINTRTRAEGVSPLSKTTLDASVADQ